MLGWIFLLVACAVFQIGVFANMPFSIVPNFFLLLTIWSVLHIPSKQAFWVALISGLLLDAYASTIFGTSILSFIATAILLYWLVTTRLPKEENLAFMLTLVSLTSLFYILATGIFDTALSYIFGKTPLSWTSILQIDTILEVLVNTLLYLPASAIFRKVIDDAYEKRSIRA